jgi:hypothetical protein
MPLNKWQRSLAFMVHLNFIPFCTVRNINITEKPVAVGLKV